MTRLIFQGDTCMNNSMLKIFISSLVLHGSVCHARIDAATAQSAQLETPHSAKEDNKSLFDRFVDLISGDTDSTDAKDALTEAPTLIKEVSSTTLFKATPGSTGATVSLPPKKPTGPRVVVIKAKPGKNRTKIISGTNTAITQKTPAIDSKTIIRTDLGWEKNRGASRVFRIECDFQSINTRKQNKTL